MAKVKLLSSLDTYSKQEEETLNKFEVVTFSIPANENQNKKFTTHSELLQYYCDKDRNAFWFVIPENATVLPKHLISLQNILAGFPQFNIVTFDYYIGQIYYTLDKHNIMVRYNQPKEPLAQYYFPRPIYVQL